MPQGFHEAPEYDRRSRGVGSEIKWNFQRPEISQEEAHRNAIKAKLGMYQLERVRKDRISLADGDAFIAANEDILFMWRNVK